MNSNIFDQRFNLISQVNEQAKETRSRLLEVEVELKSAQRTRYQKLKELADVESETKLLKSKNRKLKITMLMKLVERDELSAKYKSISSKVERLNNQIENIDREIEDLLKGDEIDLLSERFALSEQTSLLSKIQENQSRLLKMGFPLYKLA